MSNIVTLTTISKNYGSDEALRDISCTFDSSEIVLITGPNGAGKSTLIRCISKLSEVSSGAITLTTGHVGYLSPISLGLYDDLTVRENINFFLSLHGQKTSEKALSGSNISSFLDKKVKDLSLGQKMRAALAKLFLLPNLEAILLDEPTVGLDDEATKLLIETLQSFPGLVLVASHDIALFTKIASRHIELKAGRIVRDTPLSKLSRRTLTTKKIITQSFLRQLHMLIKKDFTLELSARETILSLFNFSILLFVFFGVGLSYAVVSDETIQRIYPILFWIIFLLVGLLSADRNYTYETKSGALGATVLSGVTPELVYVSKWLSLSALLVVSALFQRILGTILLGSNLASPLLLITLGSLSVSALAVLFSTISSTSKLPSLTLPLLTLPTLTPLFFALTELSYPDAEGPWISILCGLTVLYFTLGFNLYRYGIKE